MTHMDQQVPMTFSMDRMISEIKEVSRPSNDARGAYRVIFPFLVFRLSQLQMLNHKLCVRWKKHCASNEDVERLGPQFARGLKAINEEYVFYSVYTCA